MPKSILEMLGYDWTKINSIKNFQLLDYGTNRGEKNAKPFKQWIDSLPDKRAFAIRHLIPEDEAIWTEDKFDNFIAEREKLILNKIAQYVTGKKATSGQISTAAAITSSAIIT
jgi:hypothetical protein